MQQSIKRRDWGKGRDKSSGVKDLPSGATMGYGQNGLNLSDAVAEVIFKTL